MDSTVGYEETIIRLLFHHRMVENSGKLKKDAFPAAELAEVNGKSVSVDRAKFLLMPLHIVNKLKTYENAQKGRSKWGYCSAISSEISEIRSQGGKQVYCVLIDPIMNHPPAPWDHAHAKIVRADSNFSKGFLRGYRDKLTEVFQRSIVPIA